MKELEVLRRVQQKMEVVHGKQGIAFCFNIVRCIIRSFNAYIVNESFFICCSKKLSVPMIVCNHMALGFGILLASPFLSGSISQI